MKIILSIIALLVIWGICDIIYDTRFFRVTSYQIQSEKVKKPFHFVVLSDLHNKRFGKENERLIAKIRQLSPDAVLVAGDLITANAKESYEPAAKLMEALAAEFPVYYGVGNHEEKVSRCRDKYGNIYQEYLERLNGCGIDPLVNEDVQLPPFGVRIYGLVLDKQFFKRFRNEKMEPDYISGLIGKADPENYSILIAHNPDYFEDYCAWEPDLILSGHNHGGIIGVPFLGGLVSPKCTLFPKYDGGKFRSGRTTMLLSRGLGTHTIPIRVLNRAELLDVVVCPPERCGRRPG